MIVLICLFYAFKMVSTSPPMNIYGHVLRKATIDCVESISGWAQGIHTFVRYPIYIEYYCATQSVYSMRKLGAGLGVIQHF